MPVPVPLKCPNCGSVLQAEDLDFARGIIRCSYCKALATLSTLEKSPGAAREDTAFRPRYEVPMPPGLRVEDREGDICITRRWFSAVVLFLIPFCIAWDSFLVFWYGMAFSGHAPWIMLVFPIAHVAVGVGLTYFVLATLFNRTVIIAGRGRLQVASGPVPWWGNVDLSTDDLDQLFCKEKSSNSRNGCSYSYQVWAAMRSGPSRKLLDSLPTQDQALFIEQKLEQALGMKDSAVPGELAR